jgi:Allantoicase
MSGMQARGGRHDFSNLPDLASRRVGGSVVGASDELFAERENLIKPEPPATRPTPLATRGRSTTAGRRAGGASPAMTSR